MSVLYTCKVMKFNLHGCLDSTVYGPHFVATALALFNIMLTSRGHLKLAQQVCDELGVLASSVTGVDMELKTEASLRHARTLLAANQFGQVQYFPFYKTS